MTRNIQISIDAEGKVSDKDIDKMQQALRKALSKWFKRGWNIEVRALPGDE